MAFQQQRPWGNVPSQAIMHRMVPPHGQTIPGPPMAPLPPLPIMVPQPPAFAMAPHGFAPPRMGYRPPLACMTSPPPQRLPWVPGPTPGTYMYVVNQILSGNMVIPEVYTIARLLGTGAFGTVHYAIAPDGSECALKGIKISLETSWKTETDILRQLNHPNIVAFRKAFKDKNTLWLQLEYCSGGSLQDLFNWKKISGLLKYKFMEEISSALDYLHEEGIAHRDIKPENVLIKPGSDGTLTAKLADFGIAKILVRESYGGDYLACYMQSGYRGSIYFMAPEIKDKNKKGYNLQVDIFSLGILYIALVGETTLQIGSKKYLIFHCDRQPVGVVIHQTKQNIEVSKGTIKNDTLRSLLNRMIKRNYHERPLAGEVLSTLKSKIY